MPGRRERGPIISGSNPSRPTKNETLDASSTGNSPYLARWPDLAVVFVILVASIAPLVWFGRYWSVFIDSAQHLLQAWDLISGDRLRTDRGPVFTGLIGCLMLLLGRDTAELAWAVRLLALANPLLGYFLVKRISGPLAGLLAAASISLFGYTATITEAFNVDAALLTTHLLTLLTLLVAVQKNDSPFALLSGVLLGTSILTKETAIVNVPLAMIAALLLGWNLRGVLWHYVGLAFVCAPWWAWVWFADGEVYLVGELPDGLRVLAMAAVSVALCLAGGLYASGMPARFLASARRRRWTGWLLGITWGVYLSGLVFAISDASAGSSLGEVVRYAIERVAPSTPLWPLLLAACGYAVWKAARAPAWRVFVAAVLLQAPVCLLAAAEDFSLRQFLVPQALLLCALAALIVEACDAAVRRRGSLARLGTLAAVSLVAFLVLSSATQVMALLGEPSEWSYLDRTSRPSPKRTAMVSAVNRMHEWVTENVPAGEGILSVQSYSNYQHFLDGGRHRWVPLNVDCELGRTNPGKTACVPSHAVAEAPPKPTVWYWMADDCKAIALSTPTLLEQIESRTADYVLVGDHTKYPGILGSVPYLVGSGAFDVAQEVRLPLRKNTEAVRVSVLLRKTNETPEAVATRMDADTVNHLVRCETAQGDPGDLGKIRSRFPDGIALETISGRGSPSGAEAKREARAREAIGRIYPGQ